ncbi:MAG: zinc-ribbon domain-containing protein [Deltaproteobacteria bacterium]|nr:zinc-ribbon domain-containing protein [Deltaproteobacteria bacterium]
MKVQCEKCQAEYNIDESRIPPEGLQIKCPRCMATFVVAKDVVPETAGDLFDLDVDLGGVAGDDLGVDFGDDLPDMSDNQAPAQVGSSLPPLGGGSSLPPLGGGSSLPPMGGGSSGVSAPAPTSGSEGQIFDFIDDEIGEEAGGAGAMGGPNYRIKRKSGKIFGPFDRATVTQMLNEHQLMGNEEASTDGHSFKPLGAFGEFAAVIRSLMEEPLSGAAAVPPKVQEVAVAPRGVEFADAPKPRKEEKSGSGKGLVVLLGLVFVLVAGGVAMGFLTDYGFFGHKLFLGEDSTAGGQKTDASDGDAGETQVSPARLNYFLDTYAGYSDVRRELEEKFKEDELSPDEQYLLGLSYAALLRNYGANVVLVERGKKVLGLMKEDAPESPETRKVEAAFLISSDATKAYQVLMPLLKSNTRDKEALFLAGWALAYMKKWKESAEMFDQATILDPDFAKAYHALGDLQSLQQDFENAALFYSKAVEKNPRHVNSAVEEARIHIEVQGEYEKGEKLLTLAFGKHVDSLSGLEKATAHYLRSRIHKRRHKNDKVVQDLLSAIQLAPNQVSFKAALGSFYMDMGQYIKAVSLFREALKQDPENIDAQVGMGRAMWKNDDIVQAKMLLEKTFKAAPDNPNPAYYLGLISEDLDKPEDALALYMKAKKIAPKLLRSRVAIARLNLKQGNLKDALVELTEANNFNPRSAIVHNGLGEVYLKQDNLRLAESEFREALRLDSELAGAYFNLANTLRGQKKFDEALKSYERVKIISPRYPGLEFEHARSLYQMERFEDALEMCEAAIRSNPKVDKLYVQAGLAAKAAGDPETAKKYFQTATGLNAMNPRAFFELALVLQDQKAHEQALDLFKQAVALDPKNPELHFRMGLSFHNTDMIVDAMDEFRQAIKLDGKHLDAMMELGRLLSGRLQFSEAIRFFERVVRKDSKRTEVWLALGDAYAAQTQNKKALSAYMKAYKKDKRFDGAAYRVARSQDALGRKKPAVRFYTEAVRLKPEDPMPHFYLAYVYKAMNKTSKALMEFKAYLQLRPDAPDADEVRDEIYYLEQDR